MKICLVIQNQYAKISHAIACVLKEKYGVTDFSAYIFSTGAQDFINAQTDIGYAPVLVDHELHECYKMEHVDITYLKEFERAYGPPNIWQYLYADRKLLMSIGPKEESTAVIDPLYRHEDLLRIFQARARAIEKMLKEDRPDCIVFISIGALGHLILYHVAKKLGIQTLSIETARLGNLVCLTEDYRTITGADERFTREHVEDTQARDTAKNIIKQFRESGSLNLEYMKVAVSLVPKGYNIFKDSFRSLRYLATLTKNYWRNRTVFTYSMTDEHPVRFIAHKLKQYYRRWQGVDNLYTDPVPGEDYAFYPLQHEPELSLLVYAPFAFDQVAMIRQIARSLPAHFKLYVKEHPAMITKRPKSYYRELLKIPNVRLIDHRKKSFALIRNAKLVTTITGTAGWEATLLGKPVITFGDTFFNSLPCVARCRAIEELPAIIQKQLGAFSYDEREVERFLAAMLEDAVAFRLYELWYESDFNALKADAGLQKFCDLLMQKIRGYERHRASPHI